MIKRTRIFACIAAAFALLLGEFSPAFAQRRPPRPVGTEMSRAIGNCRVAVIGGTIVGGIFGAILGGRRNRGGGAVLGAVGGNLLGGLACAIMMRNAERQDAIVAAQRAAAAAGPGAERSFTIGENGGENGGESGGEASGKEGGGLQLIARAEDVTPAGELVQVRFPTAGGGEAVSPILAAGQPRLCRRVNADVIDNGERAALPPQLTCRAEDGSWYPYQERGGRRAT